VKALSLTQPYATLVAAGAKQIETRAWTTPYRGALAIHAAKRYGRRQAALLAEPDFAAALAPLGVRTMADLPKGAVVALVRLAGCVRIGPDRLGVPPVTTAEYAFGDYTTGRWMWILEDPLLLPEPVPATGALSLWEWDPPDEVFEPLFARWLSETERRRYVRVGPGLSVPRERVLR
jgi:activating signal cointegrator 1